MRCAGSPYYLTNTITTDACHLADPMAIWSRLLHVMLSNPDLPHTIELALTGHRTNRPRLDTTEFNTRKRRESDHHTEYFTDISRPLETISYEGHSL